jgi:tetratricopeptide (TPR) repeat protein
MKPQDNRNNSANKPRLSLAQKMRLLARRHRASERRRKKRGANRADCRKSRTIKAGAIGLAFLAIVAFSSAAWAASATPTFDSANAAFASGNYHGAIEQYNAILARDGYSAPVLFNAGNAYYRDGQIGEAILSYERAQVLAPRDAAIAANLRLARAKAGAPAPIVSEVQKAAHLLNPNTLAWIGSAALAAVCLAVALMLFFPTFSQSKLVLGVAVVMLVTIATSLAIRWPEFDRAIAVVPNTAARIAPADTAAELFALKAGQPVTVVKNYGQFVLVRTRDGRAGWASGKEIGFVE